MKYKGQVVGITFKSLTEISDANHEILNRNLDPETIREKMGIEDDDICLVQPIMRHEHAYMNPHPWHYRCLVTIRKGKKVATGFQDLYESQLDKYAVSAMESEDRFFVS